MERLTMGKGLCANISTDHCHEHKDCYECTHGREVFRKLGAYEDTGLTPEEVRAYWSFLEDVIGDQKASEELMHLRELARADKEGRMRILPKSQDETCGSCGHFKRIPGKRCGTCDVRSNYTDRWGNIDTYRGTFTPSQSRKCCKQYIPRE